MKSNSFEQASRLNLKFQESENTLYIPKLWHRVQTMDEIETDMKMPTSPPIVETTDNPPSPVNAGGDAERKKE